MKLTVEGIEVEVTEENMKILGEYYNCDLHESVGLLAAFIDRSIIKYYECFGDEDLIEEGVVSRLTNEYIQNNKEMFTAAHD